MDGEKFKDRTKPCLMLISDQCGAGEDNEPPEYISVMKDTSWVELPGLGKYLNMGACVIVVNNFLIFCGGEGEDQHEFNSSTRCYIFDPRSYKWSEIGSMNNGRAWFTLTLLNNEIYAVGGTEHIVKDVYTNTDVIEKYSFETNTWTDVGRMTTKPLGHATCAVGKKLYMSGGLTDVYPNFFLSLIGEIQMYCFDTVTKECKRLADMLSPLMCHHMVVVGDEIYAVPRDYNPDNLKHFKDYDYMNDNGVPCLERYSIATDQWSCVANQVWPTIVHSEIGTIIANGLKLYIIHKPLFYSRKQNGYILNLEDNSCTTFDLLETDEFINHVCFITFPAKILKQGKKIKSVYVDDD